LSFYLREPGWAPGFESVCVEGLVKKKGDEIVVTLKYFKVQLDCKSDLRISHRIRDSKGASKVVHKETLYLNIRTQSILYRMFTANQEIILNLNLTFKVKKY
jgi:hypothetical protein